MATPLWGDGALWGDDIYYSSASTKAGYVAYQETNGNRLALVLRHISDQGGGLSETFALHSLRVMLSPIHQIEHTFEAYVDLVAPSERIALNINLNSPEAGALYNVRLKASRKQYKRA
jgi:hypothetical protein